MDATNNTIRVDELRHYMNSRFDGWPDAGLEVSDVGALIEEHGTAGMAAASMVLLPSLEAVAKTRLARGTFYKYKRLATSYRRRKVKVNLRVPENSWK